MNHWTVHRQPLVTWSVTFPSAHDRVERLFRFAEGLAAAGALHETYIIGDEKGVPGREILIDALRTTGELASSGGAARVAYFAPDGRIAEDVVTDLGDLLHRVGSPSSTLEHVYAAHQPPLVVRCHARLSVVEVDLEWPLDVSVLTYSDIWFPAVVGFLDDPEPPLTTLRLHDNSALAARHTPRLNRFLSVARQLATDIGADWGFDEPSGETAIYAGMCGLDGVRL